MLHGCGQERIPSGTRARGPLVQHVLLFISPERPEVPGQVVQDHPCDVSVGPPGAYRVGVLAECDAGWRARVSCRVHHGPVGSQRPQPTVRLRRRSTSGEPVPGLRVWGFARSSRHIGEPGWTMSRIMSGKVPSEVRGNRAAVARGEHVGERSSVLRRIAVQDHQVRRLARSDAPGRRRPADDRRWRRRERRKDLSKRHAGLGHQRVLIARVVVVHAAGIGTEDDGAASVAPSPELACAGRRRASARGCRLIPKVMLPDFQRRDEGDIRRLDRGQHRVVPTT